MAPKKSSSDAASSRRVSVSPSVSVKRERSEEEEESARRVSQRTTGDESAGGAKSMDELVLKGLRSDDTKVLETVLNDIADLICDGGKDEAVETVNEEAQSAFYQLGGHTLVVGVMEKHLNDSEVQEQGLLLLTVACRLNDSLCNAIVRVGGMQAVLKAMRKHSKDERVILFGLQALYFLTRCQANADHFVAQLDGISLILKCMKTFQNDERITFEACDLLHGLCEYDQFHQHLHDKKVASSLTTAYYQYTDNNEIQERAGEAIKLLF